MKKRYASKKNVEIKPFYLNDRQSDLVCRFNLHEGDSCPVQTNLYVIYRTIQYGSLGEKILSHIHLPMKAGLVNWSHPVLGRVYDYMVVNSDESEFFDSKILKWRTRSVKTLASLGK